ncbi:MAG TPA: PBP1A family penicillin-binding protein [Rhodocyclaceae bacterium]
MKEQTRRWLLVSLYALGTAFLSFTALVGIAVLKAQSQLPTLEAVTDYRPRIPLRVYTADGDLIGEFGEERRSFVTIDKIPNVLRQAIIAAEDERFYAHRGIDVLGVMRAAYANLIRGSRRQGASTITMQVARNFFLSTEKTLNRKLFEALLAIRIENNLSKDQILELYVNQIYLGQRAYGFGAASQVYFGKTVSDLNLGEAAVLAGLPKAPSAYNPIANLKRAKQRQEYVLRRMHELGAIDDSQLADAIAAPIVTRKETTLVSYETPADHAAEMARQIAIERFGEDVYTRGYKVITTLRTRDQRAARAALENGVRAYDRRHGYRGPEAFLPFDAKQRPTDEELEEALGEFSDSADLSLAVITEIDKRKVTVYRRGGETLTLSDGGLKFAAEALDRRAPARMRFRQGAVVRLARMTDGDWEISQVPDVEAALVAADPSTGAIRALVGGYDFGRNQFNHVTQAMRQPGSSFKPFIYSAALERGYTPASVLDDTPVLLPPEETGGQPWEPKNYDDLYDDPMRLRIALAKSKNMVAIRLLQAITPAYARDFAARFGIEPANNPAYLTMALGSGTATPWQMVGAYSVFANGGYLVMPYLVDEIRDENNQVIARFEPRRAGTEDLRAIDPRNAWTMDSMLRDVVAYGTAVGAGRALKRLDLAGKTGTTNDNVDAWFTGYHRSVVAVSWIGFDQPKQLGSGETGGRAALPIWIDYMREALADTPIETDPPPPPPGMSLIQAIDLSVPEGVIDEWVYDENVPPEPPVPSLWSPFDPLLPGN